MKIRPTKKLTTYAVTLIVVAMTPASSLAAPVKLLCDPSGTFWYGDRPAIVEFDEQQGLISVDVGAEHMRNPGGVTGGYDGLGGVGPAKYDQVPAKFTSDSIVFYTNNYEGKKECWSLNRLTGDFRGFSGDQCTGENKDTWVWRMWTCHQAQAKF